MNMNEEVEIVHDVEASGLLDASTVDYTASPWKLKDSFKLHVVSVQEWPSGKLIAFYDGPKIVLDGRKHKATIDGYTYVLEDYEPLEYLHCPLNKFPDYIKKRKITKATAHNGISYDLLVYKTYFGMDYTISEDGVDTWCGKQVYHNDTLVTSKTQNPDRYGGHSLDHLSKLAGGDLKVNFRPNVPQEGRFKHFAADMLYYNLFDLKANRAVDNYLKDEAGAYPWQEAITLEKCVADLIARQSHRGFAFDSVLAEECIKELDDMMQERRLRVEPLLPVKKATKGVMDSFTPPKSQFKKNGELSANMLKFAEKIQGVLDAENKTLDFKGEVYALPLPQGEPLVTEVPASIDDTTHIKEWLVSLGWNPSERKEKDLTINTKRQKITQEKYIEVVERYVTQTLDSSFALARCEYLEVSPKKLKDFLLKKDIKRPVRVMTNPSFTKGQDKEMCPDLDRISGKFPFAKDVIEYLTFKHRRNSILGGGLEWEDEDEAEKGFMSVLRDDGRVPTPADTCGAATSRMKHKGVCNIPRVTSLYGEKMRSLFMADPNQCFQIGYDFASLEARIESHYCFKYEEPNEQGEREYCQSLLLEKPYDVHTKTSQFISNILMKDFSRSNAKAVKYGCTYGAQAAKVAKTIGSSLVEGQQVFDAFWNAALPLKLLKEALQEHWEANGKKFIVTIDKRKVPTRAAHAILNSLFQSAGVICAKRSMVRWETLMKQDGLFVDFWVDDWRSKEWGQQMIAYHDEAQIEVTKGSVKFKWFKLEDLGWKKMENKEEQKKEDARCLAIVNQYREDQKQQGKIWSEPHESPKGGWFIAYSRVGELVVKAVEEATQYYNLKVPLSADYVVGRSWSDCH